MEKENHAHDAVRREMGGAQEKMLRSPSGDVLYAEKGFSKKGQKILLILLLSFSLILFKSLSKLIFQIFLAVLLSLITKPLAALYEKKLSRPLSCLFALLTLFFLASGIIALLVPQIVSQIHLIGDEIPNILSWGQEFLSKNGGNKIAGKISAFLSSEDGKNMLSQLAKYLSSRVPLLFSFIGKISEKLSRAFISPVLAYYFLRDRELFCYRLSLLIPLKYRKKILTAMREVKREAGGYIRGQMLVAAAVGALTALGLFLTGVPAFLVLGILMGICEMIPYIGPFIGGVPAVLFALSKGWIRALWALGVVIGVQQLESIVIAPRLMSGALGLHPVCVLILLTAGGMLFGLPGLILCLPVFVCLRGFLRVISVDHE